MLFCFYQVMFVIYDLFVWAGLATAQQNGKLMFLKVSKMLYDFWTQLANQGEKREAGKRVIVISCCVMNFTLRICFSFLNQLERVWIWNLPVTTPCCRQILWNQGPGRVLELNKGWNFQLESLQLLGNGNSSTHTKKPRAGGSRASWGPCQGRIQGGSITCDEKGLS